MYMRVCLSRRKIKRSMSGQIRVIFRLKGKSPGWPWPCLVFPGSEEGSFRKYVKLRLKAFLIFAWWPLTPRPYRIIAKDVKIYTYCCYVRCATLIVRVWENALAPNRRNSLPLTVRTARQRLCNQIFKNLK